MTAPNQQPVSSACQRPEKGLRFAALRCLLIVVAALAFGSSCSSDTVRCRKVTAQHFMRRHNYKGIPSDAFIGTADGRAFKQVHRFGFVDSWEVLWTPIEELPVEYLRTARDKERGFRSHFAPGTFP